MGEENEREITIEEVKRALNETKGGKAPGMDGVRVEMLKEGGVTVLEWLVRLFNVCFMLSIVPVDWVIACMVPLYKGKGDMYECSNFRGISLLSVVGKVYGRVLINRIRDKTENVIAEVQGGFRRGRGCTDQIFTVRQICEKYLGKGKDVYFAFLDLEKAYDRVDRDAMWNVLRLYGIGGRLLRGVKSFYVGSKACVRVGNEVSEWFPVRVGLRQGCVMSPWLFNLYMDGVVREVNARVLGRGLKLVDGNENEWELNQLLFADDTVVVADSERKLCQLVTEFGRVCERRKLQVNVGKSKVMRCTKSEDGARLNVMLNGEALEEVDQFKYLGSVIEEHNDIKTVIDLLKYHEHNWTICVDLKMVNFLLGQQRGFRKYPCYLCMWDSLARERHWNQKEWPILKTLEAGMPNIVIREKIIFPLLHIKLGLMKQFVKVLDTDGECFQHIYSVLPGLSFNKIKAGVLDGPQIRALVRDQEFDRKMNDKDRTAWLSFVAVMAGFLGNKKADNYEILVANMLSAFRDLGCNMRSLLAVSLFQGRATSYLPSTN